MALKVEYVPIGEIRPYEGNAKKHTQKQIERIKQSITDFGFNDPIAVWRGEIVEGHGRLYAARDWEKKNANTEKKPATPKNTGKKK